MSKLIIVFDGGPKDGAMDHQNGEKPKDTLIVEGPLGLHAYEFYRKRTERIHDAVQAVYHYKHLGMTEPKR